MNSLVPGMIVGSVSGLLRVAPLVSSEVRMVAQLPDTQRTDPYSFRELAERWECSIDTVESVVAGRGFKIGRNWFVRPARLLEIEREREAA